MYCIHCGSENKKNKICRVCNRPVKEIDIKILEYIKGKVSGDVIDSVTDTIISFIKHHIYGIVLTISIIVSVSSNVIIRNNSIDSSSLTNERPEYIKSIVSINESNTNSTTNNYYIEYLKNNADSIFSGDYYAEKYAIVDLDNNGTPELIVISNEVPNEYGNHKFVLYSYNEESKEIFMIIYPDNSYFSELKYRLSDSTLLLVQGLTTDFIMYTIYDVGNNFDQHLNIGHDISNNRYIFYPLDGADDGSDDEFISKEKFDSYLTGYIDFNTKNISDIK